jgi:hypothetical protein
LAQEIVLEQKGMKRAFLICCIVGLALISLSCAPEATLDVSLTETDVGVTIENVGGVDCIVFVTSPDREQRFELAVGESVLVTDISEPIEVSAVSLGDDGTSP